jgi:hypothetical protein
MLSRINYMREVEINYTELVKPHFVANFLYQESLRVLNEHSMRLLLENSFTYKRHTQEAMTEEELEQNLLPSSTVAEKVKKSQAGKVKAATTECTAKFGHLRMSDGILE